MSAANLPPRGTVCGCVAAVWNAGETSMDTAVTALSLLAAAGLFLASAVEAAVGACAPVVGVVARAVAVSASVVGKI